jgi:hypothetical protein
VTFEIAKSFTEAIIFTKTPWTILSHAKYSMVGDAGRLAIEAQDHQRAIADAPAGTLSACHLPSCPALKMDQQIRAAVSSGFCLMLFYQIYDIDYALSEYATGNKTTGMFSQENYRVIFIHPL